MRYLKYVVMNLCYVELLFLQRALERGHIEARLKCLELAGT